MASYAQLLDSKGQPLPRSPAALPGVGRYRFPGCRGFHGHVGERPVAGNVSDGQRDSRSLQAVYILAGLRNGVILNHPGNSSFLFARQ